MLKLLVIAAVFGVGLSQYGFDEYSNKKKYAGSKDPQISFEIATKSLNSTHFKTYLSVKSSVAQTMCMLVIFCAKASLDWADSNILAVDLFPSISSSASVVDLLGDEGTQAIKGPSIPQSWALRQKTSPASYSYDQKDIIWKVEAMRPFEIIGSKCNVSKPDQKGGDPQVAVSVFPHGCPSNSFTYGSTQALASEFYTSGLKPTAIANLLSAAMLLLTLMSLFLN